MNHTRDLLAALALAGLLAGCGAVEVRNPFAGGVRTTPVQTALASTKAAIESATEWYVDACVLKTDGLAASDDACATYRDHVDPALVLAQNRAAAVAADVEEGLGGVDLASRSIAEANTALVGFAVRYELTQSPWVRMAVLALETLRQRLIEAAEGDR